MPFDTRNVSDRFKGWAEDLIREDVKKASLPFAICMSQLVGDFNFSSVIRSANALGASEIFYFGNKKYDRRGAVGTHHYSSVNFLSSMEDFRALKSKYVFVALENNIPDKEISDIRKFSWPKNSLILIGEEGCGLQSEILDLCQHFVEIPMLGSVRSYNAAVAASIAMYDYLSKNHNPGGNNGIF